LEGVVVVVAPPALAVAAPREQHPARQGGGVRPRQRKWLDGVVFVFVVFVGEAVVVNAPPPPPAPALPLSKATRGGGDRRGRGTGRPCMIAWRTSRTVARRSSRGAGSGSRRFGSGGVEAILTLVLLLFM
jgi:hypothetical protein